MKRKQVMILFMTALLLTGCGKDIKLTTGLAKNEIFKIQGETEELAEVTLVLVNEKNSYENSLGQDIWNRTFDGISLENEIKEKVKKQLIELFVIHQMAKKDGMTWGQRTDRTGSRYLFCGNSGRRTAKTGNYQGYRISFL